MTTIAFQKNPKALKTIILAGLVVLIIVIAAIFHAMKYVSTDDAFIANKTIQQSSRIPGQVSMVFVKDNQMVRKGDLLVQIDPRDYAAQLAKANANLETAAGQEKAAKLNIHITSNTAGGNWFEARAGLQAAKEQYRVAEQQAATAKSQLNEAEAELPTAFADARFAAVNLQRYQALYQKDEISKQQLDQAYVDEQRANAVLAQARQHIKTVRQMWREKNVSVLQAKAQVQAAKGRFKKANIVAGQVAQSEAQSQTASGQEKQAQAELETALLNLSYTKIYAPESGTIANKMVEAGNYVQPGQPLFEIVLPQPWVIANYKETQLTRIRPGQYTEIRVDAYPGKIFKGHVDSIQSGTGAAFSLFPPENASGNYVKVVQRVPVKIVFDEPIPTEFRLTPGMSVVPRIKVR